MRLLLVILFIFSIAIEANANRIPEIEEYYSKQTSEYLKTRFPDKPFMVFTKIFIAEKTNENRKQDSKSKRSGNNDTRLPYLGVDDYEEHIDFWSRTDLPLATLISQVDKVEIKVKIDSTISDEETAELKASITEQLKLVPQTDVIEFTKMDWTKKETSSKRIWITIGFLCAVFVVFAMMFALSKVSVRHLIKGLESPLSEIGKSTKAFANNAANAAVDSQYMGTSSATNEHSEAPNEPSLGTNLLELRNSGLELLKRNIELLSKPDAETMEFIERHGAENPRAMGAILAELDNETLKELYTYGQGHWWFIALSQPAPISQQSLKILNELDRLRLRRNFNVRTDEQNNASNREIGLVFGRLSVEQLKQVFSGTKIEDAESYFKVLPRALALALGKSLYPGQWAVFLNDNKKVTAAADPKKLNTFKEKAIQLLPLRREQEIQDFFRDLDLVRYLDIASFRDEKEFYMVLSDESKIKKERIPYYKILDAKPEMIKLMGPDLNVKEWAYILFTAETHDKEKFLSSFASRLSYLIKEEEKKIDSNNIDITLLRAAKKKALNAFLRAQEVIEWKDNNESAQESKANTMAA